MIDKDKMLPLVEVESLTSNRSLDFVIREILTDQRDADWQRIQPLVEAVSAFLPKLAECETALEGIYRLALAHGVLYEGPNYNKEREAVKLALAALLGGKGG